jgi:hypothetical protein
MDSNSGQLGVDRKWPPWVTALAHEFGYLKRHDQTDTPHGHRVLYRLGVWRVRQWEQEAKTGLRRNCRRA